MAAPLCDLLLRLLHQQDPLRQTNNGDQPRLRGHLGRRSSRARSPMSPARTSPTGNGIAGICRDRPPPRMVSPRSSIRTSAGTPTTDRSCISNGPEFAATLDMYKTLDAEQGLRLRRPHGRRELDGRGFGTTGTWETSKLARLLGILPRSSARCSTSASTSTSSARPAPTPPIKIPIVLDLMCISSQTDHPEEAYLLAKWMSFGSDGYLKRIEISSQTVEGIAALNMTPLQPDEETARTPSSESITTFTEFRKVVEYDDYIIEPNKYVPGYIKARWTGVVQRHDDRSARSSTGVMSGDDQLRRRQDRFGIKRPTTP
ncbi:MAG: hypothetical protein MZU97_00400 [Bacillus subtilis]|nr:hypothetical protein [Bacillus subtilis]